METRLRDPIPSEGSIDGSFSVLSSGSWGVRWSTDDFINTHKLVRESGKFNFECCRIPIPTAIRHDRLRTALGVGISPAEQRILSLLEFGMPIDCKPGYGIKKPQKNHFSAVGFSKEVGEYFRKGVQSQALMGPFESPPVEDM